MPAAALEPVAVLTLVAVPASAAVPAAVDAPAADIGSAECADLRRPEQHDWQLLLTQEV